MVRRSIGHAPWGRNGSVTSACFESEEDGKATPRSRSGRSPSDLRHQWASVTSPDSPHDRAMSDQKPLWCRRCTRLLHKHSQRGVELEVGSVSLLDGYCAAKAAAGV